MHMCIFSFIAHVDLVCCNYVKPDLNNISAGWSVTLWIFWIHIHTHMVFLALAMTLHISVHASYTMHTEHKQVYLQFLLYLIIAFGHNEEQSTLKDKKAPCTYNIKSAIHVSSHVFMYHMYLCHQH